MLRIFFLFIFSFFLFTPRTSWACSCIMPISPEAGLEQSKAVFLATVDNIENGKYEYIKTYHFNINKAWKGNTGKKLTHTTGNSMCDYQQFKTGESYLIYASEPWGKKSPNEYTLTFCSRTKNAKDAEIEMLYLDAIVKKKDTRAIDNSLVPILQNGSEPRKIIEVLKLLNTSLHLTTLKPNALEAIIALTEHPSLDVKRQVAIILGNYNLVKNEIVTNALKVLLNDKDPKVYMPAVSSLKKNGRRTKQVYKSLNRAFNKYIKSDNISQHYISSFLSALAETAPEEKQNEVLDLLIRYIPELDNYPKITIIQQVGFMKDKAVKAVPLLLKELEKSTSQPFGIRQYTIMALGWIGDEKAIVPIAQHLTDSNCYVTKEATISIHMIGGEDAIKIIKNKAMPELTKRFDKCTYEFSQAFAELKELALPALPVLTKKYQSSGTQSWIKDTIKHALKAINTIESLAIIND